MLVREYIVYFVTKVDIVGTWMQKEGARRNRGMNAWVFGFWTPEHSDLCDKKKINRDMSIQALGFQVLGRRQHELDTGYMGSPYFGWFFVYLTYLSFLSSTFNIYNLFLHKAEMLEEDFL